MQKYILLFITIIPFSLVSCTTTSPTEAPTQQIEQNEQSLYIDVREPSEWAAGHIDGAILVPLGQIEAGDFSNIPKDVPVKLYCRSGRRAGVALDILQKAGYTNVTNVGGIDSVPNVQIVK